MKIETQVRLAVHSGDVTLLQSIFKSGKKVPQALFDYTVNNADVEGMIDAFLQEGYRPTAKTLQWAFWHSAERLRLVLSYFDGKVPNLSDQCFDCRDYTSLEALIEKGLVVTTEMVQTAIWNNLTGFVSLLLPLYKGRYNFREELIFMRMANRPFTEEIKDLIHEKCKATKTILAIAKATEDMQWTR